MWEPLVSGLMQVFSWPAIGYLGFGIILGIWLGAQPGVGGVTGLILLLPFTYTMDPVSAFALMLGMFAVTTTSDTIASVMLGIPGTRRRQRCWTGTHWPRRGRPSGRWGRPMSAPPSAG